MCVTYQISGLGNELTYRLKECPVQLNDKIVFCIHFILLSLSCYEEEIWGLAFGYSQIYGDCHFVDICI